MACASHVWYGGGSAYTFPLNRVESKAFRLITYPHLAHHLLPLKSPQHCFFPSFFSIDIPMPISLRNFLTAYPPPLPRPRYTRLNSCPRFSDQTPYVRVTQHLFFVIPFDTEILGNNGYLAIHREGKLW